MGDDAFPRTMTDSVVAMIREAIIGGEYRPGDRLTISSLSQRFDVSTMPVRSALAQLERDGLVALHAHRGAVITELSVAEIDEIYEMRCLLESLAIRWSVPKMKARHLDRIEALCEECNLLTLDGTVATDTKSVAAAVEINNRFHIALYEPCERPHLLDTIARLRSRVLHYVARIPYSAKGDLDEANRCHSDLVDACRAGDVATAELITIEHLRSGGKLISSAVEAEAIATSARESGKRTS